MKSFFEYSSPEETGLSSEDIMTFLADIKEAQLYMHSLMIIHKGKIVTEAYWKPVDKDFRHRMYSASKSFVAGAVGLLIDDGKIKLMDKVCDFFPEYEKEKLHPYTRETTVRDLLIMATPFELTYSLWGNGRNRKYWVESFFTATPNKPAGTIFCYDTTATFMLDVIVERIVGKPFMEFLYERMLCKLDFSKNPKCIKSPDGYSWGGSGVLCTTLDLAKYAYVFMKNGKVNGEQLISEQFVKEAISQQIETDTYGYGGNTRLSMGYGYQIWRIGNNGFGFCGMGNQHAFCYPDRDLVIVCTADNQGKVEDTTRVLMDSMNKNIVLKCSDAPLPKNNKAFERLKEYTENLSLEIPKGKSTSNTIEKINNCTYKLIDNNMNWETIRFEFGENEGKMYYKKTGEEEKSLCFGYGEYVEGELPETQYSGDTIDTPLNRGYRYVGAGVWPEETHLLLRFNVLDDYIGNLTCSLAFTGDKVGFRLTKYAEGFLEDYQGLAGGDKI